MKIDYRLLDAGWAECTVSAGNASCEISASYLTDALGNLMLGAYGVVSGFASVSVSFDEEPGEYRWVLRVLPANELSIDILQLQHLWSFAPDGEGKAVFSARSRPSEFAKAVLAAAETVLARHGVDGYLASWVRHPFPLKQLELLRESVAKFPD